MNFMPGRSGFCEDITSASSRPPIIPSTSLNFNFIAAIQPAASAPPPAESSPTRGDDSDDHMRGEDRAPVVEREHMFDKVVTPSDVGKLNRLVIPKQHAEKYFPLDSSSNEKGLLLNFEDRNGKPWRFRYSYWNSSQSYVMTKGWSRFVKEKKLDAGDVVSFQRGVGEQGKDRLFIDWRHRPDLPEIPSIPSQFSFHRSSIHPWSPLFLPPPPPARDYSHFLQPIAAHHHQHYHHQALTNYAPNYAYNTTVVNGSPCSPAASIMYFRSTPVGSAREGLFSSQIGQTVSARGRKVDEMVFNAVPVVQGKAAAKRLRLFGVNMDLPINSDSDGCDLILSSTTTQPQHPATMPLPPPFESYSPTCSSSINQRLNRSSPSGDHDKGKASMSLDLDI